MNEPTVQVPVSLIRRAVDHLDVRRVGTADLLDKFDALLSQPTVTAEFKPFNPEAMRRALDYHGYRIGPAPKPSTEPPRIEDMAPGTMFTALVHGGEQRSQFQRINAVPGSMWQVFEPGTGHYWHPKAIDPSTIRDVTPPAVTS